MKNFYFVVGIFVVGFGGVVIFLDGFGLGGVVGVGVILMGVIWCLLR